MIAVAERAFTQFRQIAQDRPTICCIAVSHSDRPATERWLQTLGGSGVVEVVVDAERSIYAAFGLGASSFWHALNPWAAYSMVQLGREKGIWNRPTESESRWQRAGSFAMSGDGRVKWAKPARTADEPPDFEKGVASLEKRMGS